MADQKPSPKCDTKVPPSQPVLAANGAQPQAAKPEQPNPKAEMEPRSIALSQGDGEN